MADPIGAAYNTVKDAVDGVYDAMGGGEGCDVGALLCEIVRAAIAKDGDEVTELIHDFRHFGREVLQQLHPVVVEFQQLPIVGGGEVLALVLGRWGAGSGHSSLPALWP